MLWATRRGCHVDRAACIWLIRRFVDSDASFAFFGDPAEAPEGAELFDVVGARLSHRGEDCSFETFLKDYELEDRVLHEIADTATTDVQTVSLHDALPTGRCLDDSCARRTRPRT